MAVQRLHHHRAMFVAKRVDFVEVARDQRRRHQLRKVHHKHLFRRVAHGGGVVHYQRLRMQPFEQMRRGDISEVERRVLPQQDDVEGRKRFAAWLAKGEMIADFVTHRQRLHRRHQFLALQGKFIGRVVGQPVPALLCFQQQREGRIAADVDARDRVHLDGDFSGPARFSAFAPDYSGIGPIVDLRFKRSGNRVRQDNASRRKNNQITPDDCRIFPHSFMDWPRLAKQGRPRPLRPATWRRYWLFLSLASHFRLRRGDEYGLPHCRRSERRAIVDCDHWSRQPPAPQSSTRLSVNAAPRKPNSISPVSSKDLQRFGARPHLHYRDRLVSSCAPVKIFYCAFRRPPAVIPASKPRRHDR